MGFWGFGVLGGFGGVVVVGGGGGGGGCGGGEKNKNLTWPNRT